METGQSRRLRALLQSGIAISSELSLDGVLQSIVEATALVTGAQYVALGVIDAIGTSPRTDSPRTASTRTHGRSSATYLAGAASSER